jgi:hypothetical protein
MNPEKQMAIPKLYHVANLWSLTDYPSAASPWSLPEQLDAVKVGGFDGFTTQLGPTHAREAEKRELSVVGYFASGDESQFSNLLKSQKDAGARYINVQLADHDTFPDEALRLTLRLYKGGRIYSPLQGRFIRYHSPCCCPRST